MTRTASAYAHNRRAYAQVQVCAYALGSYVARTYVRAYANQRAKTKLRARAQARTRGMAQWKPARWFAYARGSNGSFLAENGCRGPREPQPIQTDVICAVLSGLLAGAIWLRH